MAGRSRPQVTFKATEQAFDYVDKFVGPGRAFTKRGPAVDWIVREVRQQGLIRLRIDENRKAAGVDGKDRVQHTTTMAADEVAWIDSRSGPRQPFPTRAEGLQWCVELAHRLRLKPPNDEPGPTPVPGQARVAGGPLEGLLNQGQPQTDDAPGPPSKPSRWGWLRRRP